MAIPLTLPFAVVDYTVDPEDNKTQEVYFHISEGTRQALDVGSKGTGQFYLRGAMVNLKLARGDSSSTAQLMVGLNGQTKPYAVTNPQVQIQQMVIPPASGRSASSMLLLTQSQSIHDTALAPLHLDFGSDGGIAGSMDSSRFGNFQILQGTSCQIQGKSVPSLTGKLVLNQQILNAAKALKLNVNPQSNLLNVSFGIYGATLDIPTLTLTSMDVRVAKWPVQCLANDQVDMQFKDAANAALLQVKNQANQSGMAQKLLKNVVGQ